MLAWLALVVGVVATILASLATGAVEVPLAELVGLEPISDGKWRVISAIRAPRVAMGIGVGASLATSGALMQGMFRNPLASPSLLGLASGGALGAALALVLELPDVMLPICAFGMCLVATFAVMGLGGARGSLDTTSLLLAGIAINAIAGAGTGLLIFLSDESQLRALSFFTLGSLGGATWMGMAPAIVFIAAPIATVAWMPDRVNALMLGEAEAGHLGVDVTWLKRSIVMVVAAGVGASVAVSGVIGFVGLAVPHLVRLVAGPDNRIVLPASALLGAGLLVGADTISRTLVAPAELPIGILTTLLGGPFFIWLLMRRSP